MPERRTLRSRASLTSQTSPPSAPSMPRSRRVVSGTQSQAVTVARSTSRSPEDAKKSIRLTVKMPSSKLRQATSGPQKISSVKSKGGYVPREIRSRPLGSRARGIVVLESESEDEEDDDEVQPSDQEMDEEQDDEEEDEEDDEEEAEAEIDSADADADADDAAEMDDSTPVPPLPPIFKMTGPAAKPSLTITPAQEGQAKSVESKEMELEDDDEELSELDSEGEAEDGDVGNEDAEGDEGGEMEEMNLEDVGRSPGTGSRASTPDVSKMTKRQRSRLDQVMGVDFLQLPMEPQTKKHLTAEEHAMRRSEMARRRKNLSEKRNEEEKMDTINRLLKKQAPKRRGKISAAELSAGGGDPNSPQAEVEKANPVFVRWVSDRGGCKVGVPTPWLQGPLGRGCGFGTTHPVVEEGAGDV